MDDKANDIKTEEVSSPDGEGNAHHAPSEYINGKPYWRTKRFQGSFWAIGFGCLACYAGFAMPANTLALINDDIGPSASISWVSLTWTLTVAVGYTLVGRLSDIFGRRYFFIGGATLALIGSIVAATARTVNVLIGATVLIGLAAASQISFNYVIGELVPVKHRFIFMALINAVNIPIGAFGPVIARSFILHTSAGWRWNYYLTIILRGNLLFLMGLSWGGGQYPWKSGHVIGCIVTGVVSLVAFVLYEIYSGVHRPLVPMDIFKNFQYDAIVVLTTVGGMIYYSMTVIYPTTLTVLYSTDTMKVGWLSCAVGGGVQAGQVIGGLIAMRIGHINWQMVFASIVMAVFIGGLAAQTKDTLALSTAFATLGSFGVGYIENLAATAATFVIKDQKQMGTSNGIFGSIRSAGGVLATTIYLVILTNRMNTNTKNMIIPTLVEAGLPDSSITAFLTALNSGVASALQAVPGVTEKIILAGETAYLAAYTDAFQKVFLASIAFGGLSIIAALAVRPFTKEELSGSLVFHLGASKPQHARDGAVEDQNEVDAPLD
ncbi:siderophore iron transporter [Fonsecaea pedrosoi]|nr:siderophore iron transporter [Fonsecaea pedrosoi]